MAARPWGFNSLLPHHASLTSAAPPNAPLSGTLRSRDSVEDWLAFQVPQSDRKPLMLFREDVGSVFHEGGGSFLTDKAVELYHFASSTPSSLQAGCPSAWIELNGRWTSGANRSLMPLTDSASSVGHPNRYYTQRRPEGGLSRGWWQAGDGLRLTHAGGFPILKLLLQCRLAAVPCPPRSRIPNRRKADWI